MTVLRDTPTAEVARADTDRRDLRVRAGRALAASGLVLTIYGLAVLIVAGRADWISDDFVPIGVAWAVGFGAFAWMALPYQPENRAVWVTAVSSLLVGLGTAAVGTMVLIGQRAGFDMAPTLEGLYGLTPAEVPTLAAICWMLLFVGWISSIFLVLTLGFLLFPDGRPLTPRWSWAAWAAIPVVAITPIVMVWEWRPGSEIIYNDGSPSFTGLGRLAAVLMPAMLVLVALSVVSLIVGFRRSTGSTRQQYKAIAWGGGFFLTILAAIVSTQSAVPDMAVSNELWRRYGMLLAVVALVTSYGMAVGKYRLYGIDLVINRTLVFVLLAAFITLVYAVVVVGIGGLFGSGDDLMLSVVATAVVAVAFEPVRQHAQRWANRMVYRRRATPYEVLSDLTKRLAVSEEGEGILMRMARLLHDGTGADRATVWLGPPAAMEPAATWPTEAAIAGPVDMDADHIFGVEDRGEVVGALEVVKPRGSVLSHQERSLVEDVAGSAGLVLGYQRLNASLEQKAAEVEASRSRLVGVQDDERRRLEKDLHDGAQQFIVSLKVKIGVATRLAQRHGAFEITTLLDSLADEAQSALDDVRSLAKGIYPPVLVSDGLVTAVSALASGAPVDVSVAAHDVGRYPPEVEAAVYFNISEAVTNAVKHANPPVEIGMAEREGALSFTVSDAGLGFDLATTPRGSGLENMADRLDAIGGWLRIDSAPEKGTVVSGKVPV